MYHACTIGKPRRKMHGNVCPRDSVTLAISPFFVFARDPSHSELQDAVVVRYDTVLHSY